MTLSEDGIANALGARLFTLSPTPLIAWENRRPRAVDGTAYDTVPDDEKPYLLAEVVPATRNDVTLKGGGTRATSEGYFQVMVACQRDTWAAAGRQMLDDVMDLFPKGQTMAVTGGGHVEMTGQVRMVPGYHDGIDWRQGARLAYVARR